jgi:DNA-binding CsgD family transcriptional regulator
VFVASAGARRGPVDGETLGSEELSVPLRAPVGQSRRIVFARTRGWAFTERDRAVVALLRPHLQEAWADAEYRRSAAPRLTRRETEVLRLAAAGMSVAEIAEELCLSVGTVRKHAEHIRERLGVHSMAAATALAPGGGPG